MGRRHRLLQEHRGDRGRGGQVAGRMKYKEIQFLRVTWPLGHPVSWDGPCCGI